MIRDVYPRARIPDPDSFHPGSRIQGLKQCCGSGMFIPDPDFYPSRIPDPKTATKERDEKICYTFFCSHKFHKIEYFFIFEMLKKKIWAKYQRIFEVFTQKMFTKLS
jgi:hypothetical protein